ncbi:MAG: hypothetical protein LWW99_08570, partial [Deltaproteobacteria bacterium]|nr:hypothetical protein [Deltaproteobacteria bacterium]
RWKWYDGFSTGIILLISRIEKGRSKKWPAEQNVVVGLLPNQNKDSACGSRENWRHWKLINRQMTK